MPKNENEMSNTYAINTKDPLGNTITCTTARWNEHILTDSGHTIMGGNEKAVEDTLSNPDSIYQSSQSKSRTVYFKEGARDSTYNDALVTKVITERTGNKTRKVVSAWPQKSVKGGIADVIYDKEK